ncbi:MAG: alpha/beta hydrolase [Elusimicrobia bacterium]|nr:alpha/beta hydrolase [Elusimicrobiota bacterium]
MPVSRAAPQTITFDGPACRLSCRDWGGEGLPVLLIHGMSGNTHWWDGVAPRLPGLRPIALDLRGHGESGWTEDVAAYEIEAFAEDIAAARGALGLERLAIAAHSFGARVALEYAARRPTGLERLAVLDFLCEVLPGQLDRFARFRTRMPPVFESVDVILERFRFQPPGTLLSVDQVREFGRRCIRRREDGKWTWRFDWRAFTLRYREIWPLLERLAAPVFVLRGERSTTMPRAQFDRFLRALPSAASLEVPRAFHHVILDAPHACAEALRAFLVGEFPSGTAGKLLE